MARFTRLTSTFIILFALSACSNQPSAATPAPVPTRPAPTATGAIPVPLFERLGQPPVFEHGGEDSWYSSAVEPGAILHYEELYHMFFNGFAGWPAHSAVGYASSKDGLDWEVSPDPLLDSGVADFPGFTFFVSSVVQLGDGSWAMYLYTLDEGRDGAPGQILMATASTLNGSWSLKPEPILTAGEPGSWDGSRVTQPHVLPVDDGYWMFFSGYENDRLQGGRWIGLATSVDGYTWIKNPDPIFVFSEDPRAWDARRVFQPRVVAVEDAFLMLYKSNISVGRDEGWGLALSTDGMSWKRFPGNPVIDVESYSVELRRNGIGEMLVVDGRLLLFLEILEREGGAYHHGNAAYASNIYLFEAPLREVLAGFGLSEP